MFPDSHFPRFRRLLYNFPPNLLLRPLQRNQTKYIGYLIVFSFLNGVVYFALCSILTILVTVPVYSHRNYLGVVQFLVLELWAIGELIRRSVMNANFPTKLVGTDTRLSF